MTHEHICKKELAKYFDVSEDSVTVLDRLKGGMSNSNYICEMDGEKYTFRIPGKNAENFVSRIIESETLQLIEPLHIDGNLLIHLDLKTGYKISKYVEGDALMTLNPEEYYQEAAKVLRKLHTSPLRANNNYAPFERLKKYETLVLQEGLKHGESYFNILNQLLSYKEYLNNQEKYMCHNDAQPSNFIHTTNNELLLVDWEFGGNNDPMYDIACFGNNDFKFAEGILPVYLGKTPTNDEWKRLYLWRTFQCLQWHNVALYKEATGLSQELHLDFKLIADAYITKANAMFAEAKKYE